MIKKLLSLIFLFISLNALASLYTINYQGLVTDPDGRPLSSQLIGLRFRILDGENVLFIEQTCQSTNNEGLISHKIGSESEMNLKDIDWNRDNLTLEVSLDLKGGKDYTSTINSSISSVPTSFYSLSSADGIENTRNIELLNSRIENLERNITQSPLDSEREFCLFMITNCICIGDSVTEGHIYDYPYTPQGGKIERNSSYPAFLSKMTGWNIENAGFSGFSVSDWWNSKFSKYDYSNYDLAILELGYNDGLTDTLYEDVISKSGAENYNDTNTGNYCKIIEGILKQNPDIIIILNISSRMTEESLTNGETRSVILQIAERYGLPVIDLTSKDYIDLNSASYHGFTDSTERLNMIHFNKRGYCAKAAFIHKALSEILSEKLH